MPSVRDASADAPPGKRINLDPDARFVPTSVLRAAYVRYADSRAPTQPAFVRFEDRGLELGIVTNEAHAVSRAVSSLLSCSLEDAKDERGGHLPAAVVERVQLEIISPWGVSSLWGSFGHRFVLARSVDRETSEIVATILVARRKGTVFFSMKGDDKGRVLDSARALAEAGFRVLATGGTCRYFQEHGVAAERINKVLQGRPHIEDAIKNRQVQLVFNTTSGQKAVSDSKSLRRAALMMKVPYFTTVNGINSATRAVLALKDGDIAVKPLQDYFVG